MYCECLRCSVSPKCTSLIRTEFFGRRGVFIKGGLLYCYRFEQASCQDQKMQFICKAARTSHIHVCTCFTQLTFQLETKIASVEPVLEDHPIGHYIKMWSFKTGEVSFGTGSITLKSVKCRHLSEKVWSFKTDDFS